MKTLRYKKNMSKAEYLIISNYERICRIIVGYAQGINAVTYEGEMDRWFARADELFELLKALGYLKNIGSLLRFEYACLKLCEKNQGGNL